MTSALPRLYIISDGSRSVEPIAERLLLLIEGGARMIQIREKNLSSPDLIALIQRILPVARSHNALLLINDRTDLALAYRLDGVHLGARSLPVWATRRLLGPDMLIGYSAHSFSEAVDAREDGADFATLSPIFETPKPYAVIPIGIDILGGSGTPPSGMKIYALGGINTANIGSLAGHGFYGGACMGEAMVSPEPAGFVRAMNDKLGQWR